jgi:hypothetical protein
MSQPGLKLGLRAKFQWAVIPRQFRSFLIDPTKYGLAEWRGMLNLPVTGKLQIDHVWFEMVCLYSAVKTTTNAFRLTFVHLIILGQSVRALPLYRIIFTYRTCST